MRALLIDRPGSTSVVETDIPVCADDQILLQVKCVGFCGSDLNTFRGLNPLVDYPRIPGHEVAATILQIGDKVQSDLRIGQDALVIPYTSCGHCSSCRSGRTNCCKYNQTMGVQRDGAMAEFIVASPQKLLTAPELSLAELALVEPLTIGFHAVDRGRVTREDTVVVLGCGAIGLGVIAGAAARGARVIAVEIDDAKLALAGKCGATVGIHSGRENLHDKLSELTDGEGPNVVVEAIGLPKTFQAAIAEVCFAGRVVYIGYAKAQVEYETKYFVMKELDILGSRNATQQDFLDVIQLLKIGSFPSLEMISHTTDLPSAGGLLRAWNDRPQDFTKIQVLFN